MGAWHDHVLMEPLLDSPVIGFFWGVAPVGILLLKGRSRVALGWMFLTLIATLLHVVVGGIVGFAALAASVRLARPDSWWASALYDGRKLKQARERYGAGDRVPRSRAPAVAAAIWIALGALVTAVQVALHGPLG